MLPRNTIQTGGEKVGVYILTIYKITHDNSGCYVCEGEDHMDSLAFFAYGELEIHCRLLSFDCIIIFLIKPNGHS